jgi:hypothetical protein
VTVSQCATLGKYFITLVSLRLIGRPEQHNAINIAEPVLKQTGNTRCYPEGEGL